MDGLGFWPLTRVAVILVGSCVLTAQTRAEDRIETCVERLRSYDQGPVDGAGRLEIFGPGETALLYFGARHTVEPSDRQLVEIERAFDGFEPGRVFYEGHDSAIAEGRESTIRMYGEAGFVRWLADRARVPAERLEPAPAAEVGFLASWFEPRQIQLFFVLREMVRLRDRRGLTRDQIREELERILAEESLPGIPWVFTTMEELERAFWEYWPYPRTWWDAEARWFDPYTTSSVSGGVFTNEIARASATFRDLHMYRLLARAALAGERVFAVVGFQHLGMQAEALRCVIKEQRTGAGPQGVLVKVLSSSANQLVTITTWSTMLSRPLPVDWRSTKVSPPGATS